MSVPANTTYLKTDFEISATDIKEYAAIGTVSFICLGFLYLLIYTMMRGVPFPLEASTTLYFVTTFLALFFGFIFLFFAIMPAMVNGMHSDTNYQNLYDIKKNMLSIKNTIIFTKITGGQLLLFIAVILFIGFFEINGNYANILMTTVFLQSFLGVVYSWRKSSEKKFETAMSVFYINIICLVWFTSIIFIVISFIPEGTSDITFYIGFPIVGLILALVCFSLVFPRSYKVPPLTKNQKNL